MTMNKPSWTSADGVAGVTVMAARGREGFTRRFNAESSMLSSRCWTGGTGRDASPERRASSWATHGWSLANWCLTRYDQTSIGTSASRLCDLRLLTLRARSRDAERLDATDRSFELLSRVPQIDGALRIEPELR